MEEYGLSQEEFKSIIGTDQEWRVKTTEGGQSVIYFNGEEGFNNAKMHEPGHVMFDGVSDAAKKKFEQSMLGNNAPSRWASRYYSRLEQKPVTVDYDKLDWSKPDAQGRTKKAVLSEMAADIFKNFDFDQITRDPSLMRELQLGVGRLFEAIGLPMTPQEMRGTMGVQPSAGAIAMLEGMLRDTVKMNAAREHGVAPKNE